MPDTPAAGKKCTSLDAAIDIVGSTTSDCYNFKQLKQLLTVVFHKEVTFGAEFRVQDEESLVYWETKTSYRTRLFYSCLYTRESMVRVWKTYGMCM